MNEMKRCPFCGSNTRFDTTREVFDSCIEQYGESALEIGCTNPECGCQYWVYPFQHNTKDYDTAVKVATERWNIRAEV